MAQRTALQLTVYKIVTPQGSTTFGAEPSAMTSSGATKDVTVYFGAESALVSRIPARSGVSSTYDAHIQTAAGWQFWTTQEYLDVVGTSGLSAADLTNS